LTDINAYAELQEATDVAYAMFCDAAMAAFERLGRIDPELTQIAKDADGSSCLAAMVFAGRAVGTVAVAARVWQPARVKSARTG
jgi:hypothetical protein